MYNYQSLLDQTRDKLIKALGHLEYSYNKIQTMTDDSSQMDDDMLETWESFSSRFSRVSDIFVMKYIRTRVGIEEPGYKGTTRDYIYKAVQLGLIESAADWITIRELRNVEAYDYNDDDLTHFFRRLNSLCPTLLAIQSVL